MAMSKYETIMWEEKMKERILSHARVLYAEKLTPTSILDVISTQDHDTFTSYLVMIDKLRSTECKVLLSFTCDFTFLGDRLQILLGALRERLAPHLRKSLYKFSMRILLYSANTMSLNADKLAYKAGEDAVVRKEERY
ncbi:hypothetical protein AA0118_g4399 [Alternaria tenuissima]|nr:hypothetical protein AA0118_g4399 [Alternaria tenuissima]